MAAGKAQKLHGERCVMGFVYIKGWDIAFSIKEYFEKEMGCSIYDVLPDVGKTSLLTPKPWKAGTK